MSRSGPDVSRNHLTGWAFDLLRRSTFTINGSEDYVPSCERQPLTETGPIIISVGCTTPTIGSHNDTPSSDCYHITVLLLPEPPVKARSHYVLEAIMKQVHGTLMVRVTWVTGMLHDPRWISCVERFEGECVETSSTLKCGDISVRPYETQKHTSFRSLQIILRSNPSDVLVAKLRVCFSGGGESVNMITLMSRAVSEA